MQISIAASFLRMVYKNLYWTIELIVEKGGKGYFMGRWKEIGFKANKKSTSFTINFDIQTKYETVSYYWNFMIY